MNKFFPPKPEFVKSEAPELRTLIEIFNHWYDKEIVPLFENVVEVYGHPDSLNSGWHYALKQQYADNLRRGSTHKALLINIKPITKETAEDLLREFIKRHEKLIGVDKADWVEEDELIKKTKKFLGD